MDSEDYLGECCINCNALFEDGFDPIRHVSISFHTNSDSEEEEDDEDGGNDISILDALSSVFVSNGLIQQQKSIISKEHEPLAMCFKCAQTLSHLYQAYMELLTFSDPAARISKLIRQIELWHQENSLVFVPDEVTVKQEYDNDQYFNRSPIDSEETLAHYVDTELGVEPDREGQESEEDLNSSVQFPSDVFIKEENDEDSTTIKPRRSTRSAASISETPSEPVRQGRDRPPGRSQKGKESSMTLRKEGISKRASAKMEKQTSNSEILKKEDADDEFDELPVPKKVKAGRDRPRGFRFCPEPNCSKKYHFKWRIQLHILADHQHKKPNKCNKCSFKYFDIERLKNHICITMKERRASGQLYRCEYCGQAWAKRGRCIQHESTHDSFSKQVKCPIRGCQKQFKIPERLELHVRNDHKDGVPVPPKKKETAQCQLCGKVLSNSRQLNHHMLVHNSDKKFLCVECGKGFQQRTGLNYHMLSHRNERKYQCVLCKMGFNRSCHLKAHYKSKTHENEPEKIAELLKQSAKQNATGTVIIPQRYKFKNHATWAGRGRGRKQTNRRVQQNVEEENDQDSSSHPNEVEPSASQPAACVPEFMERGIPPLPQPIATFPINQPTYIANPFARSTAQYYGYPFTDY